MSSWHRIASPLLLLLTTACGANVVFGEDGGGAGGAGDGGQPGTGASSTGGGPTTNTMTTNTMTTPAQCSDHRDCFDSTLCEFATGNCIPKCDLNGLCPDGLVCNGCATSSCADCLDCLAACTPGSNPNVPCSSHDDCGVTPGDDVCVFVQGFCAQRCGPGSPPCPPTFSCDQCATTTSPGSNDCLGACVQPVE